jgi:hypothetical protein
MTTTSDHDPVWTCRDHYCHDASGDGVCIKCDGDGERECECTDCGHLHTCDCTHCSGTGVCPAWAKANNKDQRSAKAAAIEEWDEFLAMQSFPLTRDGFRQAWQRMFGSSAPASAESEWVEKVVRLSRAAGEEV